MVGPVNLKRNRDGESPITSDLGQGDALLPLIFPAAVLVGGLADLVGFAQVFLETTMFGNFEVMSLADSAIFTASLRPIAR